MTMRGALVAALVAAVAFASTGCAGPHQQTRVDGAQTESDGVHAQGNRPVESPPVFDQPTNTPGKSLAAVTVSFPPGSKARAHRHARSAFIMGYVISGEIRSQLDDGPVRVYRAGETFSEAPGAHHTIAENTSATGPAELLAVVLLDTGDGPITTYDSGRR